MYRLLLALTVIFTSAQTYAYAWPLPKDGISIMSMSLPEDFTANYNFEGIVALNNCSGSLVQYEGAVDSDIAMVLTNGHCLETGFPDPNTYVSNEPSNRRFEVLDKNARSLGVVRATEIIYATMTKTDMTLYKINMTVGQIKQKFGFAPLTLSSKRPDVGLNIEVISGYWQRGYSCHIEAFVDELREGNWVNKDSIRYSRPGCLVIGGTSGSPIVATGSRTVIGVNNTGNENGYKCTDNNPCEVSKNGDITYQKGYSYGQQTFWIYGCLNAKKELDLKTVGCELFH